MKFKLFKADGTSSEERDVPHFPAMEDGKGKDALRQVTIATHANQRQGNASTKTRSEVAGSGKKMHRQKGLGVGRVGDKRAIQRRGGGVSFGPRPRSYNQKVNGKVRKLALTRALIDQANDGSISLIEEWSVKTPKTKEFATLLQALGTESKTLIISDAIDQNLALATRNLPKVKVSKALEVNALDLVVADQVVCCVKGINSLISKL